ncbi:hypothetical protein FOCC_FOCC008253 [Frankliniella occidentalis]|nr:hypothetical protein FOCC_FOCC008253 [Frankliniella occidentalis]
MSGFDENPFSEPTLDNPFEDPAVRQVTTTTNNAQRGLEDYNPFEDQRPGPGAGGPKFPSPPTAQSAIMQPSQEAQPPSYNRSGQQTQLTTAEFQRRQEELERKAQELARKEEELKNAPYNVRRNNWPPLPEKCCFQPCFYQDIGVDIPHEFQKIVQQLYYAWMFHGCVMVLNILGGLALLFKGGDFDTFGLAILYMLLFTPISFLCWFRPAYKAFSGILVALKNFENSPAGVTVGIILLIVAFGFMGAAAVDILLLSKIHRIYRSTGASFAKAQQEFANGILSNETVRSAASDAAAATVRAQLSQASSRY